LKFQHNSVARVDIFHNLPKVLVTAYEAGNHIVRDFVAGYAPRICTDLGLPSPDNPGVMETVSRSQCFAMLL